MFVLALFFFKYFSVYFVFIFSIICFYGSTILQTMMVLDIIFHFLSPKIIPRGWILGQFIPIQIIR